MKGDPSIPYFRFVAIGDGSYIASVFYNLRKTTGSFYYRGAAIFFSVLFNAFSSLLEILSLLKPDQLWKT